jgi:carboxyl-terminal processing protease
MKHSVKLFFVVLLMVCGSASQSTVREVPVDELEPTKEQRQATLLTLRVIDSYHYKRQVLDNSFSETIFDSYLESLDPNKSFLSAKDIERFEIYRKRMDDALRQARIEPAFEIFRVFRQRVDERIDFALELLKRDYDFSVKEQYRFDREEAPWAEDQAALDELWRKRVKNDILAQRLKEKEPEEIQETLTKRYEGIKRRTRQLESQDVFQTFINAYAQSLEPHTAYMSPRVSENFDINMRLSLEGIGAVLRTEDEYTIVQRVVVGGPAAKSGKIGAGDRIIGVGQGDAGEIEDVIGWRLQDVVDMIRGPKDSVVRLRVLPEDEGENGKSIEIRIVRSKIKLDDMAAKSSVVEGLDDMGPIRIGVIDLPAFYRDFQGSTNGSKDFRSTTKDVRKLLGELLEQKVDGIVIDLRGNGGGSLVEAVELTGLFIPSGPVVQVKNSSGDLEVEKDPDPKLVYGGPLAVLVDRNSASASEIFAGAIQDYRRGIIVGEPTFGKGTVQTLVDLGRFVRGGDDKLGRLRLTMAQFFRVNGGSTQFKGVVPDIIYPSAAYSDEHGERGLDNALPWAQISAASFQPGGIGAINGFRQKHEARIKGDPGFSFLEAEAKLLAQIREKEWVSLVEAERKNEWDEREQKRLDLKNKFRVAVGLEALTLEQEEEEEERLDREDDDDDPFTKIMLNEAVRILSDYIGAQHQQAGMAR